MALYRNIKNFWQRGRRGWSDEDVWSLDRYMARVIGEALLHLAATNHGAPSGYPVEYPDVNTENMFEVETDFEQWDRDLTRWGKTFIKYSKEVDIDLPLEEYWDEEARRHDEFKKAWTEMTPWLGSLWD